MMKGHPMHALAALLVTIADLTANSAYPVLLSNPDHYQTGTHLDVNPNAGTGHDMLMCTVRTGSAVFSAFPHKRDAGGQFNYHANHADAWTAR